MQSWTRLALMRKRCRKTQKEVAEYLGISRNTLIAYEKGKTSVPITIFIKLAKYYGCTIYDIYAVHSKSIEYDVPIEELFKAQAEIVVEEKRKINRMVGVKLPDEYYEQEYQKIYEKAKNTFKRI